MTGARVKLGDLIGGRYRLDAVAGRGGVGVVHRATDTTSGEPVQVTVLYARIRAVLDPARIGPARDALRTVAAPALAVPVDLVADPPAVVTAPAGGRSLAGLLADGPLEEAAVAALGAGLAAGLAALHAAGVVHRWIRPASIALGDDGTPVLLDVGVTELLKPQYYTAFERLIGTTGYVSPEQVWNEPAGPATDVYSLGLVLLEALTGSPAYPGTSAADAVGRTLVAPVVPATADPRLAALLTAATAFSPEDRPSAAELASALAAPAPAPPPVVPPPVVQAPVGPRVPVAAAPPTAAAAAASPPGGRRRRGVLVTGALALLAALALAGGSVASDELPSSVVAQRSASGGSAALGAEHAGSPVVSPSATARPRPSPTAHPVRTPAPAPSPAAPASVEPSAPASVAPVPAPPTRTPTPSPTPTSKPEPTSTPHPTASPTVAPTRTPSPTPTPSASAAAASRPAPTSTPAAG